MFCGGPLIVRVRRGLRATEIGLCKYLKIFVDKGVQQGRIGYIKTTHVGIQIMSITATSLTHPTMIAKIRSALFYAHKGQGHKMGGHGSRCYIQNAKGRTIMRLDWMGQRYTVLSHEGKNVTKAVRQALQVAKAHPMNAVSGIGQPKPASKVKRVIGMSALGMLLTGCQANGAMSAMLGMIGGLFV